MEKRTGKPGRTSSRGNGAVSTQRLLDILRGRISNHEIAPGARLREQDLVEEFGVPRARIREVFEALQQRGLIERIPNQGATVKRLDIANVFAAYAVREVLEGLCARLAAINSPPGAWDAFIETFGKPMEQYIRDARFDEVLVELERLRSTMVERADNPVLASTLEAIRDQTRTIIKRIIILPGRAEVGLQEHRALLGALQKRDGDEAERLARLNFRSGREFLERFRSFVL